MSYQVLARKWRPKTFNDMVGQEAILRMMANALDQQRIHHAYLFTGTRGVGKTTLARILAKSLNCEKGVTSTPCGECATCKSVDNGQFLDLYEIDAASRTKVEDTRELLDNVLYPPTQGRYKIYLIDEVHMLSNHSFNALLKTLEEPPEHVKFLLATTDPKKLPVTILSRCLQFHLKRILPEQIASHLQDICEKESIEFDTTALGKLAQAADGSMRDALSLLDQAIAYGHGKVTLEDVTAMLGSMSLDDILPIIDALIKQDGATLIAAINQLAERAPDFQQVLEEIINLFHRIAITQVVPDANTGDKMIADLASTLPAEEVQLFYQIATLGRRDINLATTPQQGFEMTMLRILAFKPNLQQTTTTEKAVNAPKAKNSAAKAPSKQAPAKPTTTTTTATKPTATSSHQAAGEWRDMIPKLGLKGMSYALASNCSLKSLEQNTMKLILGEKHQAMLNDKLKERMAQAISEHLGSPIRLDIEITKEELDTPVKQQQAENATKLASETESIMNDPKVKQLVDTYDATVEVSLV